MTDRDKMQALFDVLGTDTRNVQEYLYAAGRRYTFDDAGVLEHVLEIEELRDDR